jgi:osmotically-inducible protein OsmY
MYQITIKVNGEEITLTGYPSEIISEVVLAMLKTLKGVEDVKDAVIEIKK